MSRTSWRRSILGVALAALVLSTGLAQGATTLRWKFQKGEKLKFSQETEAIVDGNFGKSTTNGAIEFTVSIGDVDKDGTATASLIMTRFMTKSDNPMAPPAYDTAAAEKDAKHPLAQAIEPAIGKSIPFKITALGAVSDLKIPGDVQAELAKAELPMFTQAPVSDSVLSTLLAQCLIELPKDSVDKGKSWKSTLSVTGFGDAKMTTDSTFTYDGVSPKESKVVDKIQIVEELKMEFPADAMFKMDIKEQEAKGTAFFDSKSGKLSSREMKSKRTMGNDMFSMTMEMSTTVKLLAGEPKAGVAPPKAIKKK